MAGFDCNDGFGDWQQRCTTPGASTGGSRVDKVGGREATLANSTVWASSSGVASWTHGEKGRRGRADWGRFRCRRHGGARWNNAKKQFCCTHHNKFPGWQVAEHCRTCFTSGAVLIDIQLAQSSQVTSGSLCGSSQKTMYFLGLGLGARSWCWGSIHSKIIAFFLPWAFFTGRAPGAMRC